MLVYSISDLLAEYSNRKRKLAQMGTAAWEDLKAENLYTISSISGIFVSY